MYTGNQTVALMAIPIAVFLWVALLFIIVSKLDRPESPGQSANRS